MPNSKSDPAPALHSTPAGASKRSRARPTRFAKVLKEFLEMASAHAQQFAYGDEDQLPPVPARPARRPTTGPAPPVPSIRNGWQGGKPLALLRHDIAARAAGAGGAAAVGNFSDDEDYLKGQALAARHESEAKKRNRQEQTCICDHMVRPDCYLHGVDAEDDDSDDDDDDEEEEEPEILVAPLPPRAVVPVASSSSSSSSVAAAPSNASELMGSAVREAFLSGIEQGKRMQLPQLCKTCAVRKERNRVAAKESRQKKRREAESVSNRSLVARAADFAASRAGAGAGAAASDEKEEEIAPPPF